MSARHLDLPPMSGAGGDRGLGADRVPPRSFAEAAARPVLILLGGRSGCGKTTLVDLLIDKYPLVYGRVSSFTSRARRPGEGNSEYTFVTREVLDIMHASGELLSLDEAYGEHYGMSRQAIAAILDSGRFAIKEMHAKNHPAVLSRLPETISVLLQLADERWREERGNFDPVREQRLAEDRKFYAALDPTLFEITHRIGVGETPDMTAQALHAKLQALALSRRRGPGL